MRVVAYAITFYGDLFALRSDKDAAEELKTVWFGDRKSAKVLTLIELTPALQDLVAAAKEWRQDSQTASRLMSAVDAFEEAGG